MISYFVIQLQQTQQINKMQDAVISVGVLKWNFLPLQNFLCDFLRYLFPLTENIIR